AVRSPEIGETTLDGADELARRLARDDGGREPQMLLARGQLVLQQAHQIGRERSDVAAERVRCFDQRCVEEVVAAEDERVERSESGTVERVALGHEPDRARVATLERDGADDGRGGNGAARADEPHTERFVAGSPLIASRTVHGRVGLPNGRLILGPRLGVVNEPAGPPSRLLRPATSPYIRAHRRPGGTSRQRRATNTWCGDTELSSGWRSSRRCCWPPMRRPLRTVPRPATRRTAGRSSSATARAVTAKTVAARRRPSGPTSATSPSSRSWTSSPTSISSPSSRREAQPSARTPPCPPGARNSATTTSATSWPLSARFPDADRPCRRRRDWPPS